jgi:hypothetical protein
MTITSDDYYCIDNGARGVVLVPRKRLQAALDRFYEGERTNDAAMLRGVRTHDATPSQNNLGRGGKPLTSFLPGSAPLKDQGAQGSPGSQGSPAGGRPRTAQREPERPALRAGAFSVDRLPGGTGGQHDNPYDARAAAAARTESEDQSPLPSSMSAPMLMDEEPDEDMGLGEVVAQLPDPGEGMTYRLSRGEDGTISIVVVEDDGADMNQNDAAYRHKLNDAANVQFMKRMNSINRRRWSRTKDANSTRPSTLFRHRSLLPGERLELQEDERGHSLVLFSKTTPDMTGEPPPATATRWRTSPGDPYPAGAWTSAPREKNAPPGEMDIHELTDPIPNGRTGDHRIAPRGSEAHRLAQMNAQAREFWAAKR